MPNFKANYNDMDILQKVTEQIELHSAEGISACFAEGLSPQVQYHGRTLIEELIGEYTRGSCFRDCVKVLLEHGVELNDDALRAVLLNDATALSVCIERDKLLLHKTYSLPCAYTPLFEATLLHICAEFNHVACAAVLLKNGANVDIAAGLDRRGFGGHSPVFHTVNQNGNHSEEMLFLLLEHRADLRMTVPGLIWGKDYPWETFIPAVNPVSYAMMGLLPQMHRDEKVIAGTVSLLLNRAYGISYTLANIPNAYLHKG